jgi:hypothetical protein
VKLKNVKLNADLEEEIFALFEHFFAPCTPRYITGYSNRSGSRAGQTGVRRVVEEVLGQLLVDRSLELGEIYRDSLDLGI